MFNTSIAWRTRIPKPPLWNNFKNLATDCQMMHDIIGDSAKGIKRLEKIAPVFHRLISGIYFRTKWVIIESKVLVGSKESRYAISFI